MHEVAITGIGIVSCLGIGVDEVTESLRQGRSGIVVDPQRQALGFRSALTGRIDGFEAPPLDRKQRRTMTEFGLQACQAAMEAIAMAGWSEAEVRSPQMGLIVGNDSTAQASAQQVETVKQEGSTFPLGASLIFQTLNSTVTMNLNTILGNLGASWSVSAACASGSHAVGQAADLIASGRQERVLCGGVQEINWESVASFDSTNAFSLRQDAPQTASRPFDAGRDGLIPSGGVAMIGMERLDVAKKRGAQILGRLLSYAFSSDGRDLAVPSGEGLRRCMEGCLREARMSTEQVDYISAHATSTLVGDAVEAEAIASLFGGEMPWVSSNKSMTGHEMWMSGASQVVYALAMAGAGFIAPNINFERQEDGAAPLRVACETIECAPRVILCNSAGFGGTNSCLLLESSS
ncbi:MAG: beta-ketoacyl-[acyl-carrier-protein] synthase family protein [Phycisphaerales bacterium]|nr:MAG: beta-ketoacyl-[acyl-carrier-protein] synthase family protein [Phycisphaerales bacterium]